MTAPFATARLQSSRAHTGGVDRGLSRRARAGLAVQRVLDRRLNPFGVWIYRLTKGGIARPWNRDVLLLTTRGRHSDRQRTVVLQFIPDDRAMIVAAANDGGRTHPGWYFNLISEPKATVDVNGRPFAVRAEVVSAAAAAAWWSRIVERDPAYRRYPLATTREIPIIRLVPLESAHDPGADSDSGAGPAMSSIVGNLFVGLSGSGFPLTQLAIRRFGRRGAVVVEGVSLGLLARDAGLIATGAPARLRRGPAVLLWLETITAVVAAIVGLAPVVSRGALARASGARPTRTEGIRRAALGTLFGLHSVRLRLCLRPDHGLRTSATKVS